MKKNSMLLELLLRKSLIILITLSIKLGIAIEFSLKSQKEKEKKIVRMIVMHQMKMTKTTLSQAEMNFDNLRKRVNLKRLKKLLKTKNLLVCST